MALEAFQLLASGSIPAHEIIIHFLQIFMGRWFRLLYAQLTGYCNSSRAADSLLDSDTHTKVATSTRDMLWLSAHSAKLVWESRPSPSIAKPVLITTRNVSFGLIQPDALSCPVGDAEFVAVLTRAPYACSGSGDACSGAGQADSGDDAVQRFEIRLALARAVTSACCPLNETRPWLQDTAFYPAWTRMRYRARAI